MDGIQQYGAPSHSNSPTLARPVAFAAPAPNPTALKAPSDYARALRRKVWLVFLIGVPLSVLAAVWAVRQPPVYQAKASIMIEPPSVVSAVAALVATDFGRLDVEARDKYLPDRVALLKNKALAEEVVNDPAFLQGSAPDPDAADELVANLQARIGTGTNWVHITLDGADPARTALQLSALIEVFTRRIKDEASEKNEHPMRFANESTDRLERELKELDAQMLALIKKTSTISPDGSNILQAEYEKLGSFLMHKKMRYDEFQQQAWASRMFPKDAPLRPGDAARLGQIDKLQEIRSRLTDQLRDYRRVIRNFNNDASVKHTSDKLKGVLDRLEKLQSTPTQASLDPTETLTATMQQEIQAAEEAAKLLLGQFRESMPEHTRFLTLQEERKRKLDELRDMQKKRANLQLLSQYQNKPVSSAVVAEPLSPIRPRRALNILMGIVLSFGLGVGFVCLLEHLDHSVKVPEHLTIGLTLPLLGVVPRIRRTALTHRAGHLWTPGAPESVEADAYRNLRASLLGVSDRIGPIATLLITSAKAGEGKSTTALNLAATCARAGERTLLMDVDLRRPSLADVFADGEPHDQGLVDVLRGVLPWQRTVVRTDLPNLDFLPTGDTRDTPVEVLGTLELRQLLIGLANHYDRVILDGPAVLGLADCRMLGRIVDAAVLVVRSGTHELRPLQRAKAMLEQSGVVLAGVIFNGLSEDLQNWSSYGPYQAYGEEGPRSRRATAALAEAR